MCSEDVSSFPFSYPYSSGWCAFREETFGGELSPSHRSFRAIAPGVPVERQAPTGMSDSRAASLSAERQAIIGLCLASLAGSSAFEGTYYE